MISDFDNLKPCSSRANKRLWTIQESKLKMQTTLNCPRHTLLSWKNDAPPSPLLALPPPPPLPPHSSSEGLSPFLSRRNKKELKTKEAVLLLVNHLCVRLGEGELLTPAHLLKHQVQWEFQLIRGLQSCMQDPRTFWTDYKMGSSRWFLNSPVSDLNVPQRLNLYFL